MATGIQEVQDVSWTELHNLSGPGSEQESLFPTTLGFAGIALCGVPDVVQGVPNVAMAQN